MAMVFTPKGKEDEPQAHQPQRGADPLIELQCELVAKVEPKHYVNGRDEE